MERTRMLLHHFQLSGLQPHNETPQFNTPIANNTEVAAGEVARTERPQAEAEDANDEHAPDDLGLPDPGPRKIIGYIRLEPDTGRVLGRDQTLKQLGRAMQSCIKTLKTKFNDDDVCVHKGWIIKRLRET